MMQRLFSYPLYPLIHLYLFLPPSSRISEMIAEKRSLAAWITEKLEGKSEQESDETESR